MNRSNNATTKAILRKINNYTNQGEIKESEFQITEDLFIWMISKILTPSGESIDENEELFITKIVGFKGWSDDQLAKVVGSGNRIMNALSTLAFLFENEEVMYVKPVVEYNEHEVELQLKINGSIDINFENYVGTFMREHEDRMKSKLTLMTCLEIVPKILSSYTEECENSIWSKESKASMINTIGQIIQDKVNEKVSFLQNKSDDN